jgi:Zn-dependent metalloprotease
MKDLIKTIDRLENKKLKIEIELNNKLEFLRSICPHENKRVEHTNYSAGYDYYAEYWTRTYCDDCGTKLSEDVKYGDSYG